MRFWNWMFMHFPWKKPLEWCWCSCSEVNCSEILGFFLGSSFICTFNRRNLCWACWAFVSKRCLKLVVSKNCEHLCASFCWVTVLILIWRERMEGVCVHVFLNFLLFHSRHFPFRINFAHAPFLSSPSFLFFHSLKTLCWKMEVDWSVQGSQKNRDTYKEHIISEARRASQVFHQHTPFLSIFPSLSLSAIVS